MKFTTATVLAASAALVTASPCAPNPTDSVIKDGDVFTILTIRSGSDLQYGNFQAANRALYVNTPKQNATCSEDVNYASFLIKDGGLYLNNDKEPQQIVVDRSGMGQGNIQYTTGADATIGRNQERTTFAIDASSNLVFQGGNQNLTFQACPGARQGGYAVWLSGSTNPGGQTGCLSFVARALKAEKPVTCTYTQ